MRELTELLEAAGHSGFRDARGPMGFTQRQASGKFTRDEADEFIAALQETAHESSEPEPAPAPEPARPKRARAKPAKQADPTSPLAAFSDEQLAAELQSRGWVVMEP